MRWFILITSNVPQAGKTSLRVYLADKLGVSHCATSDMILPHLEQRRGIKAADVRAARATNPDSYRKELIEVAEELREEFGVSFTLDAYWAGYRIVDGGRKVDEITKVRKQIEASGDHMLHLHLTRESTRKVDNTEAQIEGLADIVLQNTGTLEKLKEQCWLVVEGFVNEFKDL